MTTRPRINLNASVTVVLDGAGNGTAKIGPSVVGEEWTPANVHVSATSAVNEATCYIYVGPRAIPATFRDATFTGSTGDSTDRVNADLVTHGNYVFAVWSGGDAGASATLTVTGMRQT